VEIFNVVLPRRPSPEKGSTVSTESSISDRQKSQLSIPVRKPVTPPPEAHPSRSPSPEKPYQGVGKLIDQWQRKTADAESERHPDLRRSGFAAKRALQGITSGGTGR